MHAASTAALACAQFSRPVLTSTGCADTARSPSTWAITVNRTALVQGNRNALLHAHIRTLGVHEHPNLCAGRTSNLVDTSKVFTVFIDYPRSQHTFSV